MRLADLERAVQAHMLAGGTLPAELAAAVAPPAAERWEIYTDGYRLRLTEALGLQYPALAAHLGAERFAALVAPFIAANPSVHRSIRDYGEELAAFIRSSAGGIENEMLADLALFEWQLAGAFDAADAVPTAPSDLATLAPTDWVELAFRAVPSMRRLRTRTNAIPAWRATQHAAADAAVDETPPLPARREEPTDWFIWRSGLATEFRPASADEAAAFDALTGGARFGNLCEQLYESFPDDAASRAASWLKGWLIGGLLVRV